MAHPHPEIPQVPPWAYKLISSLTLFFKNMMRPVLFMPYGGETFVDLAQLLAAMRVVAALFGFIFGHNLFQESR